MKIFLAKHEPGRMGGGWSFQDNFAKAMGDKITTDYREADIYFIAGASMMTREEVKQAQADGKKIVLRVDNIIRNSRNRGTGMTRMKDFAELADLVIFQSEFAEDLLNPYLQKEDYRIILNATDQSIFYPTTSHKQETHFLYCRSSSDETKNWEMARVAFQRIAVEDDRATLNIVGKFDQALQEYNFDFYNNENYKYWGEIHDRNALADIYRQNKFFLYTYFNDACSNTLIEALSCGCEVLGCYSMEQTGGAMEIITKYKSEGLEYFGLKRLAKEYTKCLQAIG